MEYVDEMQTAIKEIIEDFDCSIKKQIKDIEYYEDIIEIKRKHFRDASVESETLFRLKCEKDALEGAKIRIENIFYDNDIPEEYYKIEEEK